jgi:hypothetical protein
VAAGAVVVFFALVVFAFVAFVAFVFFAFVVVGVVVAGASCANTGIASENTMASVNNSVKSFFMLGLDLLMNFFPLYFEQGLGHFSAIALDSPKQLKYQELWVLLARRR